MSKQMPTRRPTLLWLHRNLRKWHNSALMAALEGASPEDPVVAIMVNDPDKQSPFSVGSAASWYRMESAKLFKKSLIDMNIPLFFRSGDSRETVLREVSFHKAKRMITTEVPEPRAMKLQSDMADELGRAGVETLIFKDHSLVQPGDVATKANTPFKVFTPFWNALKKVPVAGLSSYKGLAGHPLPVLTPISGQEGGEIPPAPRWAEKFNPVWFPGEMNAHSVLNAFLSRGANYDTERNLLSINGTSRLGAALHWGEISPLQIWHGVSDAEAAGVMASRHAQSFLRQLAWRQFAQDALLQNPQMETRSWKKEFDLFPYQHNPSLLDAWKHGQTGYPLVDAAMVELWETGYMHNRARMISASFLCKHLLQPWQLGAEWFWDTLVDAGRANNLFGWQWAAGCGMDAAPFFRIFNPVSQGQRFDPKGAYIRKWLPQLEDLPDKYIHCPWLAPLSDLQKAGIVLGKSYPLPIVDHKTAREKALAAYQAMKARSSAGKQGAASCP